jgi:hypothetical protein
MVRSKSFTTVNALTTLSITSLFSSANPSIFFFIEGRALSSIPDNNIPPKLKILSKIPAEDFATSLTLLSAEPPTDFFSIVFSFSFVFFLLT